MKNVDALERKARTDLMIDMGHRKHDPFLWEHAQRVAHSATGILGLVGQSASPLELQILRVAAWYHDAGWVAQLVEGQIQRHDILARPMSDLQRELSAALADKSLRGMLPSNQLQTVCTIIRQAGGRNTANVFAQVLADACNLDQIGPLALWHSARRDLAMGKGVDEMLATWERQCEYNYWQARIRDSLQFEAVRKIALQRLKTLETFMSTVSTHARGQDLPVPRVKDQPRNAL